MKRTFGVLLFVCILIVNLNAEYPTAFQPGEKIVQAGLGFGVAGVYGDIVIPPISVSVDIAKEIEGYPISFGGLIGYSKSEYDWSWYTDEWKWTYTYFMLGARAAYHLKMKSDKIDPYGGLMLGYNIVSVKEPSNYTLTGYSAKSSYMMYGFYCGARYFFNPNMAIYTELGYGFGYLNLGLSFKL